MAHLAFILGLLWGAMSPQDADFATCVYSHGFDPIECEEIVQ